MNITQKLGKCIRIHGAKCTTPNVIKNFALSEDNLLPEKIKSWVRYYKNIR